MLVAAGIAAGATLAVDQVTKAVARASFEPGETRDVALDGAIAVGHVHNYGSAYGLIEKMPAWLPAAVTGVFGGAMLLMGRGSTHPVAAGIGAGLLIGGGVGNVIDRVHQGYVTDMFHTGDMFRFYNVADVALNAGIVLGVGIGASLLFR